MSSLNKAVELFMAGRYEEARRACRKAVQQRPDLPEAHLLLAETQRALGDEGRAGESEARVLRLRPDWTPAHALVALGDLYNDFGRHEEAEARYRRALELRPALADARFNLAGLLQGTGRADEAIEELQKILAQQPEAVDARERLLSLLFRQRRIGEMEAASREGMVRLPRSSRYPGWLGTAMLFGGRYEEALEAFALAVECASTPEERQDAGLSQANALLALGRYEEGWAAFGWRHPRARLRGKHPDIVEDASIISRLATPARIRIYGEQGVGDEIFFLRFAAALRDRGHRLSYIGYDGEMRIVELLAGLPGFLEPASGGADYAICSGDLPLASGKAFAPPLALPVDPARRARIEAELRQFGPPPYIGVTWRAGVLADEAKPQRGAYLVKELPPEGLGSALAAADVRVVILQRRPAGEDLRRFKDGLGRDAWDLSRVNNDLRDALAALFLLDDYVGVSNTNMHLRAALPGKSARVLVSMPPEWRWALKGSGSPWFPDFTVYRRAFGEDWAPRLSDLEQDLRGIYAAPQQR